MISKQIIEQEGKQIKVTHTHTHRHTRLHFLDHASIMPLIVCVAGANWIFVSMVCLVFTIQSLCHAFIYLATYVHYRLPKSLACLQYFVSLSVLQSLI